nr:LysR family transcriptional regulator [Pseudomonas sp. FFPRI_1]
MANLEDLELFVLIAELQGLSPAARAMSITPAAASLALKRLENRLGVRLFTRSTRLMKLTSEGARYLDSAQHALKILAQGQRALSQNDGQLELSVSSDLGRHLLLDLLLHQKKQQPKLQIRLSLNDKEEDLFTGRFDAALRFGHSVTLDLVELPILKQHHFIACASPAYLASHHLPDHPEQLSAHDCVVSHSLGKAESHWRFHNAEEVVHARIKGLFCCDDGDMARRWALAGQGVCYLPLLNVVQDLQAGRLQPLLPGWSGDLAPLSLVVSHRSRITASLRLLHELLVEACNERIARYQAVLDNESGVSELPLKRHTV